ncbi:hypothetical protein AGMMS4956_16210 [Bacteroidia bacterium]|nr:hypothetical protein AGMMS4956_16210 [Bacteroidia bacterium]
MLKYKIPLCYDCQSFFETPRICAICKRPVTPDCVYITFLCKDCQQQVTDTFESEFKKEPYTTKQQVLIHLALKEQQIDNIMNYEVVYGEGYHKTIDICIPQASVYLEVNGLHHAYSPRQVWSDLWRTHFSAVSGFLVLNVYNVALMRNFLYIINGIERIVEARMASMCFSDTDN